ncbi:RtcB family protein [Emticicia sp. CRIBPO]|uniref:RtcB family protein n=1 Tax=Emticicia sp. CRIBPO TaxID=2683258 RepID=UPI001412BB44|nr:RtcB family protein [Emticicia sp. CRIBPO]NBA85574.1 RtcB family protein [Emticicia sp. CRIBPO]
MNTNTITGNDLIVSGFKENAALGMALKIVVNHFSEMEKPEILALLNKVKQNPEDYLEDKVLAGLAEMIIESEKIPDEIVLKEHPEPYSIYGKEQIEEGALRQMSVAMKLPVSVAGALMPDAHHGYGLPIGGVLATRNAIIPYGVGVDIGCRMALSIYDIPESHFVENKDQYRRELIANTNFGAGNGFRGQYKADHEVLSSGTFQINPFIARLKDRAWVQLGSSGGGNHFVEFGLIEFKEKDEVLGIEKGKYLALLTHSGSRGLGAMIAGYYTKLAKMLCKLPKEAVNLAYLDMNTAEGQEYWLAMNLAGEYASACHEVIHQKIAASIGADVIAKVENHHNFAWKETWNGEEVMVHRKGATPAGKGVLGIIPGSMTAPGFLVRGKGEFQSINSASHGAGRQMSRTRAVNSITKAEMNKVLQDHGVMLIGAGRDEAPMAYKDIHAVMASQTDLVDVVAEFTPKMVRMADDGSRED